MLAYLFPLLNHLLNIILAITDTNVVLDRETKKHQKTTKNGDPTTEDQGSDHTPIVDHTMTKTKTADLATETVDPDQGMKMRKSIDRTKRKGLDQENRKIDQNDQETNIGLEMSIDREMRLPDHGMK